MKFFKILKEDLRQDNTVYHEGRNIYYGNFSENKNDKQDLFFYDADSIMAYCDRGEFIAEVSFKDGDCFTPVSKGCYKAKKICLSNFHVLWNIETFEWLKDQGVDFKNHAVILTQSAIISNHLDIVKFLVENGVDVFTDKNNNLHRAASYADLETVKYLKENGADIHCHNEIALYWACVYGKLDVVKYLVKNGADIHLKNENCLMIAISNNDLALVRYLLDNGADINIDSGRAITMAVKYNNVRIVRVLVEKGADIFTGAFAAVKNDCTYLLHYFIEKGVDIHYCDDLLLKTAIQEESYDSAIILINKGSDINFAKYEIKNNIFTFIASNNFELVKFYLDKGNSLPDLALIVATTFNRIDMIKFFLRINEFSSKAKSEAFHIADKLGYKRLTEIFTVI